MHRQPTVSPLLAQAARVYREAMQREGIWLYAIQAGDESGPIKIGITNHPPTRLATLQQGNPYVLRGIAAWPGLRVDEKILHEEFADLRMQGEWFRCTPYLLEQVLLLGGYYEDWE